MRSVATGVVADPGRRAAKRIVVVGLWGGGLCLFAASSVYLAVALDMLPATCTAAWPRPAVTNVTLAAVAVLGTILVSVGAVFQLLASTGVLAIATASRRGVQGPERRRDPAGSESRRGATGTVRGHPGQVRAPSEQPRETLAAGDAEPRALPSRGVVVDGRPNASTAGAPARHAPRVGPVPVGDVPRAHAHVIENAGAPGHEAQPPESCIPGGAHQIEMPPPAAPPQPGDLIAAWDDYRRNGDGHFNRRGLQEVLNKWGFDADVGHGDGVGAGGAVLVVETFGTRNFCVLPNFNKSPRTVAEWFDDHSGGALTGRTHCLVRLARGRWVESGTGSGRPFEVLERGEVA